jgi:hypothetical protein
LIRVEGVEVTDIAEVTEMAEMAEMSEMAEMAEVTDIAEVTEMSEVAVLAPYRASGPRLGRCSLTSYQTMVESSEGCSLTTYRSGMQVEGRERSELGRATMKGKSF